MLESILFYTLAGLMCVFAVGVIACRSAIYSVLCLVATMGLMAGLFVLLKAFLVATVLILVYAGAILVLFIFVVMLIDFKTVSLDWQFRGNQGQGFFAILAGVLFFVQAAQIIRFIDIPKTAHPVHGTAQSLGIALFNDYVLPFELTSFLLLSAVVSVVVLAKRPSA